MFVVSRKGGSDIITSECVDHFDFFFGFATVFVNAQLRVGELERCHGLL